MSARSNFELFGWNELFVAVIDEPTFKIFVMDNVGNSTLEPLQGSKSKFLRSVNPIGH